MLLFVAKLPASFRRVSDKGNWYLLTFVFVLSLKLQLVCQKESSDWLEGLYQMKVVWKFVITTHGAQCVIMVGMLWMPTWPADNLDTLDTVSYSVMTVITSCRSLHGQSKFCVNNEIVNRDQTTLGILCNSCFQHWPLPNQILSQEAISYVPYNDRSYPPGIEATNPSSLFRITQIIMHMYKQEPGYKSKLLVVHKHFLSGNICWDKPEQASHQWDCIARVCVCLLVFFLLLFFFALQPTTYHKFKMSVFKYSMKFEHPWL